MMKTIKCIEKDGMALYEETVEQRHESDMFFFQSNEIKDTMD